MNLQKTTPAPVSDSERIAIRMIKALKDSSVEEYMALFPSLDEFHQIMDENRHVYGNFINEAKVDFSRQYQNELLPALVESFQDIIREGKKRGVNWNTVHYTRHEVSRESQNGLSPVSLIITFSSQGKEYYLQVDKAFTLKGEWRASQFIRLL